MTRTHPCVVGIACFAILGCVAVVQSQVTLEVTEGNSTCIKAELSASFSITYETANGTRTVMVPLPGSAVVGVVSSCGGDGRAPWLVSLFGDGHALGLSFSSNDSLYRVANLTLQYNLSDVSTFPEASSTDVVTVETTSVGMVARVNTTYRCISASPVIVGRATVTFSNVKMEAYMTGDDLSPNESVCTADQSTTTAPPPTPSTTPGTPNQGSYSVSNSNGTVCLLARMALQLNISHFSASQNKTIQEVVNLLPNQTTSSGSCDPTSATLILTQGGATNLSFLFTLNTTSNRYHLSGLSVVAAWSDMTAPFNTSNSSLDYLRGSLGRSYMCSSEQTLAVDQNFFLNTFQLQVQPFGLTRGQFAQESVCTADQSTTTAPPPTPSTTTAAPIPVPTPPGTPNQGSYSVSNSNGTVCLLARMALQLNISHFSASQNKTIQEVVNLLPNQTTSSGSCDPTSATLILTQGGATNLSFLFTLNTTSNRYHLSGLSVVAAWSDMTAPFNTSNSSLDYLRGSLGRSYMCSSEQTLAVDQNFFLNTFQLQVQPFGLTRGQFAQAEECQLDQDNMLIPIIVGAALAGLVLIVLIAYLIGRKRRHAGYQTI